MTEPTFHQKLMTAAYDRYESRWTKREFEAQLTCAERRAVLVGNMNYQVENGGFSQWLGNGYATHENVKLIRAYLSEMENCIYALELDDILESFQKLGNSLGWDVNAWDEDNYEEQKLDKRFYDMNAQFMRSFDEHLTAKYGPKPITEETTARLALELREIQKEAKDNDELKAAVQYLLASPPTLVRFADLLRTHSTRGSALRELCGGEGL